MMFFFPPFDPIWLLKTIRDFAEQQLYNVEEINDRIKENRMLFELGDIDKKTYEETEKIMKEKLEQAMETRKHITQNYG